MNKIPDMAVVSSRGQLVIPSDIREKMKINEGDIFAVSSVGKMLVMKKMKSPFTEDDAQTLKEVGEAWKSVAKGDIIVQTKEEFLKELEAWSKK